MVKKNKPQSTFYKDAPFTKLQEEDVWPVSTSLTNKLYGCKQELEKTTSFIFRAALMVWTANTKKKKKKKVQGR